MQLRHLLAATALSVVLPMAAYAEDTIKIGFPIPLSGPTAVYGEPILKGAELAVADINAEGGVLGRKLELLSRDSKANPAEAVRLARELIVRERSRVPRRHADLGGNAGGVHDRQGEPDRLRRPVGKDLLADRPGTYPSLYLPRRLQHHDRGPGRRDHHGQAGRT